MAAVDLTPAACVTALVALLGGMDGISGGDGKVYPYRRIVRNEGDIKAVLAGNGGKVNAWMVSPAPNATTVSQRLPGFDGIGVKGGGQVMTVFQFQIEAYYQINDAAASEVTFRDLAWAVANEINSYGGLAIAGLTEQLQADVDTFGYILLAQMGFYHFARISCGFRGRTRGNR